MLYAAYGSNLHPVRLSARVPGSRFVGTTSIAGKRLCFHKRSTDRSAKCNIVTGTGSIHVAVYEIDRQEKALLDRIEGVASGYSIEIIELPGLGECFTYTAVPSHIDGKIRPYSWYKELVLVGCEALQFPVDYIAVIRSVPAIEDPDQGRHARNMRIVTTARNAQAALVQDRIQPWSGKLPRP